MQQHCSICTRKPEKRAGRDSTDLQVLWRTPANLARHLLGFPCSSPELYRLAGKEPVSRPSTSAGGQGQAEQHEGGTPGERPGVAVGVTPEGSLLTVVLPPVRAAAGSRAAVPRARPEEDPPEQAR